MSREAWLEALKARAAHRINWIQDKPSEGSQSSTEKEVVIDSVLKSRGYELIENMLETLEETFWGEQGEPSPLDEAVLEEIARFNYALQRAIQHFFEQAYRGAYDRFT